MHDRVSRARSRYKFVEFFSNRERSSTLFREAAQKFFSNERYCKTVKRLYPKNQNREAFAR